MFARSLVVIICAIWGTMVVAQPTVTNLRCELLNDPISIDVEQPRLSWTIEDSNRGVVQRAYHVLVATSREKLAEDIGDVWDSGMRESDNSIAVYYEGKALDSREEVFWKVKVRTNTGESDWSETASWTMGLLYYKDWYNRWIGFDQYFPGESPEENRLSARYFRKEFTAPKKVKKAMAYMMGLGLYELYLNGKKIGDQVLAPTPTDYTQNIKYNAFDVTDHLVAGENAIGVVLGNGRFYAMRQEKPYKVKSFGFPKMQFQLFVTYDDGSTALVCADHTWKGTADGPIRSNNEYDGEEYDACKEFDGWANAGFDDRGWLPATYVQEPSGRFEAQLNGQMKVMRDLPVVDILHREQGRFILDFGQNFAGWVKLKVQGEPGTTVTLRFAESLDEHGELFTANLRNAKATDRYTLRGGQTEEWEPSFTYHGFRYVEVSNYPGEVLKENFTGRFVYDDMETVGTFESSNGLLNQIYKNAWWGIASNYKGIPIDCPQRNERQPWLGDRPTTAYGETFMFDNTNFYIKWLEDIRMSQKEDGAIPDVAPAFWRYYSDNITWPGTYLMVADMLYQQSGDLRILEQHYPFMKKWIDYMGHRYIDERGILTKDSYGDWCFPPESIEAGRGKIADKKYPSALISSATYFYLLGVMARFSELTGNGQDRLEFESRAAAIRQAFNRVFYHEKGYYGANKMTENILAMRFCLVEDRHREKLAEWIVHNIEVENNGHLSTGVVGIQWLMRTLTDMGRVDLAYKIATNVTYPSWGYMIEQGATTIWELWNGDTAHPRMNSQNHVMMLGDVLIWYYEHLAGIKSAKHAFQEIEMKPEVVGDLDYVNASYHSLYGTISSHWTRKNREFEWKVTIPPNTRAILYLPAESATSVRESNQKLTEVDGVKVVGDLENGRLPLEVGSGTYVFTSKI